MVTTVVDLTWSFPEILIALILVAIIGPGTTGTMVAISVAYLAQFTRLTRAQILTLKGEVLYPESFKYPEVECQLYADPRLTQYIDPPKGIGSMTASGTRLVVYIAVPRERIDALVGAADRLLSLELNATPLHYRRALVMSIHLGTEPEPDW